MKKTGFKLGVAILLGAAAPVLYAQDYAGQISDLNTIFDPPSNIQSEMCGHLSTRTDQSYATCTEGSSAARWMAEKHATKIGSYLGCLDGHYQGVRDGFDMTANPSSEQRQKAEALYGKLTFETAVSRAKSEAKLRNQTASSDMLIKRYREVLNRKGADGKPVLPNKNPSFPPIDFKGFNDGYEVDVLKKIAQLDVSDMVGSSASQEDRFVAQTIKARQAQIGAQLCDLNKTLFLQRRNFPNLTIWDFFKANRQYNFENYGWKNGEWAFDFFVSEENTLEQYASYKRIENFKKQVTQLEDITQREIKLDDAGKPITEKNPDGTEKLDTAGKPIYVYYNKVIGQKLVTKDVNISPEEISSLKALYRDSFIKSYSKYYARQYASKEYYKVGAASFASAKLLGQSIGAQVANYRAERDIYNKGYEAQSREVFAAEAEKIFKSSWNTLLDVFEANSVYELNDAKILGSTNDSIFTAGESVYASFDVSNIGEKTNSSNFTLGSSNLIPQSSNFSFSVAPLSSQSFTSPAMASISNSLLSGDLVNARMAITNQPGALNIASTLKDEDAENLSIRAYAEVANISSEVNSANGSLDTVVEINNAAGIASPSTADVILETDVSSQPDSVAILALGARETKKVAITTSNLDPLALISKGSVRVTVSVKMAGRIISRKSISVSVGRSGNSLQQTFDYFASLATGVSNNSGSESKASRLATLSETIESAIDSEISGKRKWHKSSVLASSSLRALTDTYLRFQRRGQMSREGQEIFDELALDLAKKAPQLKAKGLFNDKKARKAFKKELSIMSSKVK